jgi:hypothetical protein
MEMRTVAADDLYWGQVGVRSLDGLIGKERHWCTSLICTPQRRGGEAGRLSSLRARR